MRYIKILFLLIGLAVLDSCTEDFLDVDPKGTKLESIFYSNEIELFEALVATYDVLSWGGTNGWTMELGLLNTASDECHAGGSNADDQPAWVAWDNFTLSATQGPQSGLWTKNYTGIYRANLFLEKLEALQEVDATFKARTSAEAKFLRAYYYFDLVNLFGNVPLITTTLGGDELYTQTQSTPQEVYAQIESDLSDAIATFELPETISPDDFGRVSKGAAKALYGKVLLFQNDNAKMSQAASILEDVINSGVYILESNFGNIFSPDNEFGVESIFEIQHSGNHGGDWNNFANETEGNYSIQFFGIRDYVGPTYASGWGFCPVSEEYAAAMRNDPRFEYTIIDGQALKDGGATYSESYQHTDFFIKKYAPIEEIKATNGVPELNWKNNIISIRLADVLLMAAEAIVRSGGNESSAQDYVNQVRNRVGLPDVTVSGDNLLQAIYNERRFELGTEGHRFFDLVRTGQAAQVLGPKGYKEGINNYLPIHQDEINITEGALIQNPGY
jgi:hypothetical protein